MAGGRTRARCKRLFLRARCRRWIQGCSTAWRERCAIILSVFQMPVEQLLLNFEDAVGKFRQSFQLFLVDMGFEVNILRP